MRSMSTILTELASSYQEQAERLVQLAQKVDDIERQGSLVSRQPTTWRERLWTVPPETRLSLAEAAEALARSKSWIYKRTSARTALARIPHSRLAGGKLEFSAGELRNWIEHAEGRRIMPVHHSRTRERQRRR